MSPQELQEKILRYHKLGQGARKEQILGTTHEIQYTMPEANTAVIFETIKKVQAGQHDS